MELSTPHLVPTRPQLVWFGGADAIRFLNDLISQEIGSIEPGEVKRSFLLTPQGKLDFVLWALRDADRVGLVTEDGRGEELVVRLSRYRIRVDVEIDPSTEDAWLVIGPFDLEGGRWSGDRSSLVADVSWPTVPRALVVGEKPDLPALETQEYEALRIEAGEPLMGVDVTDSTIPQETGLVPTSISFDKGCFLGQELVARLDSRGGRVNHHLRILRFEGSAPSSGAKVIREDEEVGEVTSAARDVALASVKRGVEPGEIVEVRGERAIVESVPGK